jgi:hypothetical protein
MRWIRWRAVVAVSGRLATGPVWMIIATSPGTMRGIWLASIARDARSLCPEYHLGGNVGIQVDVLVVANVGRTSRAVKGLDRNLAQVLCS